MQNAGVMNLLKPLLEDNVPSIQQGASVSLGRLAAKSEKMAQSVVRTGVLTRVVKNLDSSDINHKISSSYIVRAVSKHSPDLAADAVSAGAIPALKKCLEHIDPSVKEAACWALDYITQHSVELAKAAVDAAVVPSLVLAVQEPEVTLKRIAVSVLGNIAKHSGGLAQTVLQARCLPVFGQLMDNYVETRRDVVDNQLKRQICACLAHIGKHSVKFAEEIIAAKLLPLIVQCASSTDELLSKNACVLLKELCRQSEELASQVTESGGIDAYMESIRLYEGSSRTSAIMGLGYLAASSETVATKIIEKGSVPLLRDVLVQDGDENCLASTAWTLGQIGKHSVEHAVPMGEEDVYRELIAHFQKDHSSDDLKVKCKKSLKILLGNCADLRSLEPLLEDAPKKVQKYVLKQLCVSLPGNGASQKAFVNSGALKFVQEMAQNADEKLLAIIDQLNAVFPPDLVQYYSPGYEERLYEQHFGDDDAGEEEENRNE
jgi:hypothetical protein